VLQTSLLRRGLGHIFITLLCFVSKETTCFSSDQTVNVATLTLRPNQRRHGSVRSSAHFAHHAHPQCLQESALTAAANWLYVQDVLQKGSRRILRLLSASTSRRVARHLPDISLGSTRVTRRSMRCASYYRSLLAKKQRYVCIDLRDGLRFVAG
jgi:hypothetical protein